MFFFRNKRPCFVLIHLSFSSEILLAAQLVSLVQCEFPKKINYPVDNDCHGLFIIFTRVIEHIHELSNKGVVDDVLTVWGSDKS